MLVISLLAMFALLATTFLVTSRYDLIGTQGAMISHQMEMLLSMLESDIRRKLAEDLWGDDEGQNNPGDDEHEAYDAPDDEHGWINGICGDLVAWQSADGDPNYVQYVVDGDSDWKTLPGTDVDGLQFRFAVLIQGLGGLINVNVARQPDPDLIGASYPVSPDVDHPEDWPYTVWAFHAARGNEDWGYWWWTGDKRYQWSTPIGFFAGFGETFRGGGPAQHVSLRYLLADRGELGRIDSYFRRYENLGREFDIQDELDLRYPGVTLGGAPYPSILEETLPSLFSSSTADGIPACRRRFVTAVGRTTGWQPRREPVRMHPYDDAFWSATGLNKNLCEAEWYFRFDGPHYDDLIKYLAEARMGYRISLQRGVTLSRMWPDSEFDIYQRMNPYIYGNNNFRPISQVPDVPKYNAPFMYDDRLVEYSLRDEYPVPNGDYTYSHAPNLAVFMLANTMAIMGVPSPDKDPDEIGSYTPRRYAQEPAAKSDRVEKYRELVAAFHLNFEDYQDENGVPGVLYSGETLSRFANYRDRAGAEDRVYLSEAVIEFELWPDYAILARERQGDSSGPSYYQFMLHVKRVDKGTPVDGKGLQADDWITHVRVPPATNWTPAVNYSHDSLRNAIKSLAIGGTFDVRVARKSGSWSTVEILGIPVDVAVKTMLIEVYNPHDHSVLMHDYGFYGCPLFRYNVCVPQQTDYNSGTRALFNAYPLSYSSFTSVPANRSMLYCERRGTDYNMMGSWLSSNGLGGIPYYATNKTSHYSRNRIGGETTNLCSMREGDGEILLTINKCTSNWRSYGYISDAFRRTPTHAVAAPMPSSTATVGIPAGVADAWSEARSRIALGHKNPVVRLYRPLYMESRATQFMTAWNSLSDTNADGHKPVSRLGKRDVDEDDFPRTLDTNYRHVDARGFIQTTTNRAFRFAADAASVTRLTQRRLKNTYGLRKDEERLWLDNRHYHSDYDPDQPPEAPTEVIDKQMRAMLAEINASSGEKGISSQKVRQIIQKHEARLRYSPYTPTTSAELAECSAYYNFIDALTVGGAAYDSVDNNCNSYADEHGAQKFDLGIPSELEENDPGGGWLMEHSNCWPAYGRINVNTAPREILENCLIAPTNTIRRQLGEAIWNERGGEASQSNTGYKPFKSLGELYGRVSALNGREFGFDRFGFDGKDNHDGAEKLPDMPPEPVTHIDDLEERNYLWRINSEVVTLRTDTFAAYLRFQARRYVNGRWKMVTERRVYSVWDRATCIWPPHRHDGRLHTDFVAPQRIGIQVFGY